MKRRTSGVLLPLSSVYGEYAVGVMGKEAREFIDKIKDMGFSYWQVLPIGNTDSANSPYCSCSAFAGNLIYIDPRQLKDEYGLSDEDIKDNLYSGSCYTADYQYAGEKRLSALKKAFVNLTDAQKTAVRAFADKNHHIKNYALYMSLKDRFGLAPWWEWDDEYKIYNSAVSHTDKDDEDIFFRLFVQYEFYRQWNKLKKYANEKGISILGDMPIYVSLDSADVWSHTSLFELEKDSLKPKKVAGVPPDYFSEDGQLWGNPIYDWAEMEKEDYKWWIDRLRFALEIYDMVRIDHFRAFASYWEVDADAETAKNGKWVEGPGMKLFNRVKEEIENPSIVAEDLGTFGEDVIKLLEDTKFPGMRVIQFGFDPCGDSTHLPHNYSENCIAYVGTHDNNTLLGWLYDASEDERKFALDYCGYKGDRWGDGGYHSESCRSIIETVWKSSAKLSMIAFQDMCGFGNDARMNIPGTDKGNWLYRAGKDAIDNVDSSYYRHINSLFRR